MNLRELTELRIEEADGNLYSSVMDAKKNFNEQFKLKADALERQVMAEF